MLMIDSAPLKPSIDSYQAARRAWGVAVSALAKANTLRAAPQELQRLHDDVQQTSEATFAAGAELAEGVALAICETEEADYTGAGQLI